MTELTFTQADIKQRFNGDCEVTLIVPKSQKHAVQSLYDTLKDNDKPMVAKIDRKRKKRSLDANSYMWVLCDKIAQVLQSSKEMVYQDAIRSVGIFTTTLVQNDAVDFTIAHWDSFGVGNFAMATHESNKNPGCTVIRLYFGSSTYDTAEMSRLIDYIVSEAKELGVETMTPAELERLKGEWKR